MLGRAQINMSMFSSASLARRKRESSDNADDWLDDYLKSTYEPTVTDFRKLRKLISQHRKTYDSNYRKIRNKIYDHTEIADSEELRKLFNKNNIRDIQKIFVFVNALYESLWQLSYTENKLFLKLLIY